MIDKVKKIDGVIESFCSKGLVFCVTTMLLLTVLNIVLRWVAHSIHWFDPLVRHLVFICAFLGGALATGKGTHIGIDFLSKLLESKKRDDLIHIINLIVTFVSFGCVVWLFKAGWDFYVVESDIGKIKFLGIHSKYLVGIIPAGLGLIGIRTLLRFVILLWPNR